MKLFHLPWKNEIPGSSGGTWVSGLAKRVSICCGKCGFDISISQVQRENLGPGSCLSALTTESLIESECLSHLFLAMFYADSDFLLCSDHAEVRVGAWKKSMLKGKISAEWLRLVDINVSRHVEKQNFAWSASAWKTRSITDFRWFFIWQQQQLIFWIWIFKKPVLALELLSAEKIVQSRFLTH